MPFLLGSTGDTTFFPPVRKHGERENVVRFMKTGDWFISSNVDVTYRRNQRFNIGEFRYNILNLILMLKRDCVLESDCFYSM